MFFVWVCSGMACCGNRLYNPHDPEEICCDGNLWPTNGDSTVCTAGVAHEPGEVLCGNQIMDVETQICCQDTL